MTELRQRGRRSSVTGNKKGSGNGIGLSSVEGERVYAPRVRTGGERGHQCIAVSMEPAHLLRFLPCHLLVPAGVKLASLGRASLKAVR